MSRARSGKAALPGARPAEPDAGPVPAPRNWRVATRLAVLVAIPTLLGLALTGLRITDETRSAADYGQVSRLAVLGHEVDGLAQAMEDERAGTATFIAAGRPASDLPALQRQYLITDGWAVTVRRLVHQGDRGYPAQTQASAATALASIAGLPSLRREAAQSQAPALTVINGYSAATAGLFTLDDSLANLSGDSTLITSARALGSLSRLADQVSLQQAILGGALAAGHFGPGARTALITAQAQQASDLASFRSLATPEEGWAVTQTLASPLAGQAQAVEQRATASGGAALALGPGASQQWQTGMSFTEGWMRHAQQQMTTWITSYAQATQRSMMRTALITAGAALAVLVLVLLATIIIARSMVRPLLVQREAVRLASEEARRRRSISAISNGFFRRSHYLLERLLRLIDILERSEDDPGRLASLFQIDHLVTRMRRNSDSALVLAGHETSRDEAEPVTLVDVLRAAVSEIEQYNRVVLDVPVDDWVSGDAVADTVHLLAELLENATAFSPKTTQVIVSGHAVRAAACWSVSPTPGQASRRNTWGSSTGSWPTHPTQTRRSASTWACSRWRTWPRGTGSRSPWTCRQRVVPPPRSTFRPPSSCRTPRDRCPAPGWRPWCPSRALPSPWPSRSGSAESRSARSRSRRNRSRSTRSRPGRSGAVCCRSSSPSSLNIPARSPGCRSGSRRPDRPAEQQLTRRPGQPGPDRRKPRGSSWPASSGVPAGPGP